MIEYGPHVRAGDRFESLWPGYSVVVLQGRAARRLLPVLGAELTADRRSLVLTTGALTDIVRNTTIMALVSAVYFWRAKTEEKHLLGEDPKYRAYHAWMSENALITRSFTRLGRKLRQRGMPQRMQPAE